MRTKKNLKFISLNILLIIWYFITWAFGLETPFAMGYLKIYPLYAVVVIFCFMSVFYLPALLVKYLYLYSDPKKYGIRWAIFVTICTFFWGYSIHKTQDIALDTSFLPFYLFHFILTIALITTIKSKPCETI